MERKIEGDIGMERKFCSKCGKPVGECVCGGVMRPTTGFGSTRSAGEAYGRAGSYYIKRFDKIALADGETVVRQYHIGAFTGGLKAAGKGDASIIITNKRVISKQDSNLFGTSTTNVEELNLDTIAGVKNLYAQGFTIWRVIVCIFALIASIIGFATIGGGYRGINTTSLALGIVGALVFIWMLLTCRKPSYLFSIYATTTSQAMQMGANLKGKLFNSAGNGIVFQYKPTQEAVDLMCEIGACINDLKTKGDYAIDTWKKA